MANGKGPQKPQGPRSSGPGAASTPPQRTPLQRVLYWGTVTFVWGLIFLTTIFFVFAKDLPDISRLYDVKRQPTISYLDRSGALIAVRGSQSAPPVDLAQLPSYVPDAFIAIEDRRFYYHLGFDPIGIMRAARNDIFKRKKGDNLSGGSTITQQLARNIFLSPDQNWRRKIQELFLAIELELKYSKKEILALYLNRVNFGGGANGIEAAAKRYFDKPAKDLTVGEAALLAGSIKGPSRYSPVSAPERAAKRANIVLNEMYKTKKITKEQYDAALRERVPVKKSLANQNAGYFVDWVDAKVRALVGEPTEDLIIETTLDLNMQGDAETAVRKSLDANKTSGVEQAALVAVDGEGAVKAYVGGSGYDETQFDRASNAQRQAGSSFKPFVYLTAMEQGRTPDTVAVDEPVTIGGWTPGNYESGQYQGPVTLETALARSINTIAARLASEVGTGNVAATAHRLGITGHIQTDPSMALGAVEVTPVQMAQAYDAFSNGGVKATAYGVRRIRTAGGRTLYDHGVDNAGRVQVINQPALQYMIRMMRSVIHAPGATGGRANVPGFDLAGKTGTTSDYRDAWFVGYTGNFTAAVWVGKDDNKSMKGVTGGRTPAEIWRNFMTSALHRVPTQAIPGGDASVLPPPATADSIGDLLTPGAPTAVAPSAPAPQVAPILPPGLPAPASTPAPATPIPY